jgi:hypothetical protein
MSRSVLTPVNIHNDNISYHYWTSHDQYFLTIFQLNGKVQAACFLLQKPVWPLFWPLELENVQNERDDCNWYIERQKSYIHAKLPNEVKFLEPNDFHYYFHMRSLAIEELPKLICSLITKKNTSRRHPYKRMAGCSLWAKFSLFE